MSSIEKQSQPISGFSPLNFGGCSLWLDATASSNFALSGSNITTWYDKSPLSNHASNIFAGNPVLSNNVINGRSTVYFSNAPSMGGSMILNRQGIAGFMVLRPLQVGIGRNSDQRIISCVLGSSNDYDSTSRFMVAVQQQTTEIRFFHGGYIPRTNFNASNNYIISWTYDGSVNSIYLNGAEGDLEQNVTMSNVAFNTDTYRLGSPANNTFDPYNGHIGEVIIYNDFLTVAQRRSVEGYLAWKWGIAPSLGTTFSPLTSLSNCAVWFDGADPTTFTLSGSNITQWRDKAGSNVTSNIGTPVYVSNAINGVQGVLLDSNAGFKISPMSNRANTTTVSIYGVVAACNVPRNQARIFTVGRTEDGAINNDFSQTSNWSLYQGTLEGVAYSVPHLVFVNAQNYVHSSNVLSNGVPCLISAIFNGTTQALWTNGNSAGSNTLTNTFTFNRLGIGKNTNPDAGSAYDNWAGYVGEFLLFYAGHTEAQRLQVESYLASKWNIRMRAPNHLVPTHSYTKQLPLLRDFQPTDLDTCALWLDAGDRTTLTLSSSNTVTGWTDKSGNRRSLTVNSAGTYSATGFNGRPTIQFTNGQYMTTSTASTISNACTIFVVQQTTGSSTYYEVLSAGGATNPYVFWWRGDFNSYSFMQESGGGMGNSYYNTKNVPMIMAGVVSPNVSNYWQFYMNGVYSVNPNLAGFNGAPVSNTGGSNVYIPGNLVQFGGPAGGGFTGNISEVLIFSNSLSNAQRQLVESYLAKKWGLSMSMYGSATHPSRYGPPVGILPGSSPTGLVLWLDAADLSTLTLSGSNVTQWRDKSGNNNHATPNATSPVLSTAAFGGRRSLSFDGTSMDMYGSISITGPTLTAIAVYQSSLLPNAERPGQRIVSFGSFPNTDFNSPLRCTGINIQSATSYSNQLTLLRDSTLVAHSVALHQAGVPAIGCAQYTGSGGAAYLNGVVGNPLASSTGDFGVSRYGIANQATITAERLYGYIAEVLVFTTSLTTSERQQIEGYLASKWGLTANLPVSHPYKTGSQSPLDPIPPTISGLRLWLDAADATSLTLSGSNVTQWSDKSGAANHYIQSTASNRPVYVTDSVYAKPCLSFNGTGAFLAQSNASQNIISNSSAFSIFTAHRFNSGNGIYTIYRATPNSSPWFRWQTYFGDFNSGGNGGGGIIFASNSVGAVQGVSSFVASSTSYAGYINGNLVGSNTRNSASTNLTFSIGKGDTAYGEFHSGSIFEILMYDRLLTTAERQQVEGYLTWKWGFQASLPGPFSNVTALYKPLTVEFDPRSVGGCGAWFDAADPTSFVFATGSNLTQWLDKSGLQNHLVTNTSNNSAWPTWTSNTLNGKPVVTFNSSAFWGPYAPAASDQPQTVFMVGRPSSLGTVTPVSVNSYPNSGLTSISLGIAGFSSNNWIYTGNYGGTDGTTTTTVASTSRTDIVVGSWKPGASYVTVNGTEAAFSSSVPASMTTRAQGGRMTMGGLWYYPDNYYRNFYSGYIAEVLIFSNFMTNADRQRIEGYLAWKWGLQSQLPALHPYSNVKF